MNKNIKKDKLFFCKTCIKEYSSKASLCNHNKKFHCKSNKIDDNQICKFCKKCLSNYSSRWRHEKCCKEKKRIENEIKLKEIDLENNKIKLEFKKEEIKELELKIKLQDSKNNYKNNNVNIDTSKMTVSKLNKMYMIMDMKLNTYE